MTKPHVAAAIGGSVPPAVGDLPRSQNAPRFGLLRRLSTMAAAGTPADLLFDEAVREVAAVLQHEYCKVLELLPGGEEVKLVAGVGWKEGLVGVATVGTGQDSQAGYTLRSGTPVVVADLRTEERFWGPPLLREHGVVSGISAIIPGRDGPWGVLGVHSTTKHEYDGDDAAFVEAVAGLLGVAIVRSQVAHEAEGSRDQAARALRREETRSAELRGIIAALGDGILVFDERDRLLLMNRAAEAILAEGEIRSLSDLSAALGISLAEEGQSPAERQVVGTDRWVEVATYRVGPDIGGTPGAEQLTHENRASTIAVIRDVTEGRAAREAREAFVGMLSHELRTPLTTIYGGVEILALRPGHARREEIANDVRGEADRLRRMVENVLVLSRVERNELELAREPVSLAHVVPAVIESEQRQSPLHSIELTMDATLPPVAGEPTYIEQVLRNFLGNAAKFTPAGSPIQVRVLPEDDWVVVAVRDRGPGFEPDEGRRLFGLFFRTSAARFTPGSGIGLFVSRKLVELMGGSVAAATVPEGGAEFSFRLRAYSE